MKIINLHNLIVVVLLNFLLSPAIQAAQPAKFYSALNPNDTYFSLQTRLQQIKAPEAWEIIKESPNVVVAIIDSGVDIDHPDLQDNIWRNLKEIPGDGLDNDKNGFVDDVNGWDFVLNSPDPRPKFAGPFNRLGMNHGTVVAGVIGAKGNNNFGVAGISWKIKIMPLRVMDGEGTGTSSAVYQAVEYAIKQKAEVINLSMVGEAFDPLLNEAIAEAYRAGIVIVAAAGNENGLGPNGEDFSLNLALHPQYPICHDGQPGQNYVLGVGSVDENDVKSVFSNFGSECLDLVAPGEGFLSTQFYSPIMADFYKYFGGYWSGTSLAAPQVSAAAALLKALKPGLTNAEIYQLLMETTDNIDGKNPDFKGLLGSGRLNLSQALNKAMLRTDDSLTLISAGSGEEPYLRFFNSSGTVEFSVLAYDKTFKGGVGLALGDLEGNGLPEIITSPLAGVAPVKIFNIRGDFINQFYPYDKLFKGGVKVISGDIEADGSAEIITSPLSQFKPLVRVFDKNGQLKQEFLAFKENDQDGLELALVDVNADGKKEILVYKKDNSSAIRIFSSAGKLLLEFNSFDNLKQSIAVTVADISDDPRDEIIVAENKKNQPKVRVYSSTGELLKQLVLKNKNNSDALRLSFNQNQQLIFNLADQNKNYLSFYGLDGLEISRQALNGLGLKNFNWAVY